MEEIKYLIEDILIYIEFPCGQSTKQYLPSVIIIEIDNIAIFSVLCPNLFLKPHNKQLNLFLWINK